MTPTLPRTARRPVCLGCSRPCPPEQGYATATGWVHVHDDCLARVRAMWMRGGGR